MHDPMAVAFYIKSPLKSKPSRFWPNGYRNTIATIWHVDPEMDGSDDSCGWSFPRLGKERIEQAKKLGAQQYGSIFSKRVATAEGKSYAYVCNEPTTLEAVYWAWRALKRAAHPRRHVWQYGPGDSHGLSRREQFAIWSLASSPVDNVKHTVEAIASAEDCGDFFVIVERCRLRIERRWYQHPKWHVWHWQIQIQALQSFKRWAFSRCATCGKRFSWGYSPSTHNWNSDGPRWFRSESGVCHSECLGHVAALRPQGDPNE